MTNTKKTMPPTFGLVGLNWEFKIKPKYYPMLEIHAAAFWFGDRFPSANAKLLEAKITETIKQSFVCNGGDCERHRLGAEPCAGCLFCDEEGNV